MRSSRVLEKECYRYIEVMWLFKDLAPDHNTISNFRRDNDKAIRKDPVKVFGTKNANGRLIERSKYAQHSISED